ncbi:cysteine desulfurase [Candidatus Micrarchaeota archaeon]|nr:cysteine desulfurase [Candidatus Micrarchaeota archaeon]MBI5177558.1 cysteine desulfurase [Candidatus Micrarchaeota archaeon]
MFDATKIRGDFPILSRKVNGKRLVYLDNASTTQKPIQVINAISDYYSNSNANVHRGIHALSMEASGKFEESRRKTAAFIGASGASEIVFTKNATESLNLVANSLGSALGKGGVVVLSEMEHHSNIVPWQLVCREKKAELRFIPVKRDGTLDLAELDSLLEGAKIVSFAHVSNALGTINDVKKITNSAHKAGALVCIDGAQSVPHLPVGIAQLGSPDFMAFSAHKMLGPTGVGVLYGRKELLESMPPFLGGGDMIREVKLQSSMWNEVPHKFEAGTPDIAGVIAFGAALDYLKKLGMGRIRLHEGKLLKIALQLMGEIPGVSLYGPRSLELRGGVVSFNVEGIHPHDAASVLDSQGVAVRAGHHCAMPLMRKLGLGSTVRASFYAYNAPEEVEVLANAVKKAKAIFS